jgi:subtilisin family serine protease
MSKIASVFRVFSLCFSVTLCSTVFSSTVQAETVKIKASTLQQIQALLEEKASLTPEQRKIDFHLLQTLKTLKKTRAKGPLNQADFPHLRSFIKVDKEGKTLVDIKAKPEVIAQLGFLIAEQGGKVVSSISEYGAIRAHWPIEKIEWLAHFPQVQSVTAAIMSITNKLNTSEGDLAHNTESARQSCGFEGKGVKIGVLSDSVDYLSEVQASGDLPHVTVLDDAPNNTGEGTALLEIIHDIAPGAELYFATAWKGPESFANNIKALRDSGCQIIIDDVNYLNESPFQDGLIAQAVNEVTADGVIYFSAAGNSGNFNKNHSGVWEGEFKGSGMIISDVGEFHDFQDGDMTNALIKEAPHAITLFWSDPLGESTNDYDLFLLNANGELVDASRNWQTGTQDPFEILGSALPGEQILIVKYSGENRYLHLNSIRGRLEYGTDGHLFGHAASKNALAIGAVRLETDFFKNNTSVEWFSSDGPRRVFYEADGTPITPGDFSAIGGELRQKPDFVAVNGVMTATPNQNQLFNPYYGTSASAAHAAAMAGLLLSGNPALTPSQIRAKFTETALDIEAPGWDRDSGAGLIMGYDCVHFGVNDGDLNDSQLFTFDANAPHENYAIQALGPLHAGHDLEGMALNPIGELYATSGNNTADTFPQGHLYKVNKSDGELTSIGQTGFREVSAISFRPDNETTTLWGWADGKGLIEIDTTTAASTMRAPSDLQIEAMTWSHDGQFLYGVEGNILYQYTFASGELRAICDNLPFEAEAIVSSTDGELLISFHEKTDLGIHSFNISECSIIQSIESPYNDIEAMTLRYDWSSAPEKEDISENEPPVEEEIPDETETEITTVKITDEVLVADTIPLGINLGADSYYGPSVFLKVRDTENFEGTSYRQLHQGTLFKDGFASCWNNLSVYEQKGWAELMRDGGQYTLISGPDKWTSGQLTAISSRRAPCSGNEVEALFFAFDKEMPSVGDTPIEDMGILVENLKPITEGHLGKPGSYWGPSTNCTLENDRPADAYGHTSLAMDGTESEASFRLSTHKQAYANLNGLWKYSFWAKVKAGEPEVVISSGKYGETQPVDLSGLSDTQAFDFFENFPEFLEEYDNANKENGIGEEFGKSFEIFGNEINKTLNITENEWKKYEVIFQINDVPELTARGYTPFLDFRLRVTNGILLVDDLAIKMLGDKNPTAFRDELVKALKAYNPGMIRNLQMGGTTVESTIRPQLESYRGLYNAYAKVGPAELRSLYSYGLHEFYELAEYIDSEPWFSLPGTMNREEMAQFIEYLGAPAEVGWGQLRTELGHPKPWTESLRKIHIEIGNEAWNAFFQGSGFNREEYWNDLFATAKASPYYRDNIILHAAGQRYSSFMANRILTSTPHADRYAIGPYQLHTLNQRDVDLFENDAQFFSWLFARSLYEINNSMLGLEEVMKNTGIEYSIYEINHHTLKGDVAHDFRNYLVTSLGAGLNTSNVMLQFLKKYGIRTQGFFNVSQFSFNMAFYHHDDFNIRLWGGGLNFRQGYERYRPTWQANELVNKVVAGNLLKTTHTGANPTYSVTGAFKYNGEPETQSGFPEIVTYAFANGNKRGLIVYNLSTTTSHIISIEFDSRHNPNNGSANSWLLTANSIAANNEPENAVPEVEVLETRFESFESGIKFIQPQHTLRVIAWETVF